MKLFTKRTFCCYFFLAGGIFSLNAQRDASGKMMPVNPGILSGIPAQPCIVQESMDPNPLKLTASAICTWPWAPASSPDFCSNTPFPFDSSLFFATTSLINCGGCKRDSNGSWLPVVTAIQVLTFTLTPCNPCGYQYDGPCYNCIPGAYDTYIVTVTDGSGCTNTLYHNMDEIIGTISHCCFGTCPEHGRDLPQKKIFNLLKPVKALSPSLKPTHEIHSAEQKPIEVHTLVQTPFGRKKPLKNSTPATELTCIALQGTSRTRFENNS